MSFRRTTHFFKDSVSKWPIHYRQAISSNISLNFHLISYRSSRYTLTSFIMYSTISLVNAGSFANKEIFSISFSCSSSTSACITISLLNSAICFSASLFSFAKFSVSAVRSPAPASLRPPSGYCCHFLQYKISSPPAPRSAAPLSAQQR